MKFISLTLDEAQFLLFRSGPSELQFGLMQKKTRSAKMEQWMDKTQMKTTHSNTGNTVNVL